MVSPGPHRKKGEREIVSRFSSLNIHLHDISNYPFPHLLNTKLVPFLPPISNSVIPFTINVKYLLPDDIHSAKERSPDWPTCPPSSLGTILSPREHNIFSTHHSHSHCNSYHIWISNLTKLTCFWLPTIIFSYFLSIFSMFLNHYSDKITSS